MGITVFREYRGEFQIVGRIDGTAHERSFSYSSEYLDAPHAHALSLSLPLRPEPYTQNEFQGFFEGMIPEGVGRTELAHRFHVSPSDYLSLLERLGSECVGALLFQSDDAPEDAFVPRYAPISEKQLKAFVLHPSIEAASRMQTSRLSLAGAQSKTGLFLPKDSSPSTASAETWCIPLGSAPSTHVLKIADERFNTLALNEFVCMLLAKECGIETAATFLPQNMERVIASERFDRFWPDTPRVLDGVEAPLRLHQEDFCQALGWPSYLKYELPDTASYAVIAGNLINKLSSNIIADKRAFARLTIFNYLIGNCDNHFKNHSFLYSPSWEAKRLAPAYDIVCTTVLGFDRKMGFEIGFHQMIDDITPDDWRQFAEDIEVPSEWVIGEKERMSNVIQNDCHFFSRSLPVDMQDEFRRIIDDAKPRLKR